MVFRALSLVAPYSTARFPMNLGITAANEEGKTAGDSAVYGNELAGLYLLSSNVSSSCSCTSCGASLVVTTDEVESCLPFLIAFSVHLGHDFLLLGLLFATWPFAETTCYSFQVIL